MIQMQQKHRAGWKLYRKLAENLVS